MNYNKATIVGRLTKNPEVKTLPSGNKVASFGMATSQHYKSKDGEKKEQTEFHNIVLFGKLAEIAESYLDKGGLVLIEGRIQTRSWEDESGVKKYRTEIIGESLQLGPKKQTKVEPEEIEAKEIPF